MNRFIARLDHATVVAYLALFLALGGGAYAATLAPKNSVSSKAIIDGQVRKRDLQPAERWRSVRAPSSTGLSACGQGVRDGTFECSNFGSSWENDAPTFNNSAAYYKDPFGVVRLKGVVAAAFHGDQSTAAVQSRDHIVRLPAGYRPAREWSFETGTGYAPALIAVQRDGQVVAVSGDYRGVSLDGIAFRACGERGSEHC